MVTVSRHGLEADVPPGWEVRIYRRRDDTPGATTSPVLHAATFALPEERGDFGGGAVETMGPFDVFVALVEYDAEAAGTALFARQGFPALASEVFSPRKLQQALPGQGGSQFFFTQAGRPFCLYVVLGSHAERRALVPRVARLLAGVRAGSGRVRP